MVVVFCLVDGGECDVDGFLVWCGGEEVGVDLFGYCF